jgi:hypothetical protein
MNLMDINNGTVRSVSPKRPGTIKGRRLDLSSLFGYLEEPVKETSGKP